MNREKWKNLLARKQKKKNIESGLICCGFIFICRRVCLCLLVTHHVRMYVPGYKRKQTIKYIKYIKYKRFDDLERRNSSNVQRSSWFRGCFRGIHSGAMILLICNWGIAGLVPIRISAPLPLVLLSVHNERGGWARENNWGNRYCDFWQCVRLVDGNCYQILTTAEMLDLMANTAKSRDPRVGNGSGQDPSTLHWHKVQQLWFCKHYTTSAPRQRSPLASTDAYKSKNFFCLTILGYNDEVRLKLHGIAIVIYASW